MRTSLSLLCLTALCAACLLCIAVAVPVAAQEPLPNVTAPETTVPVTHVTTEPTVTVPTMVTPVPTTVPTTEPTTIPTTIPTTSPTLAPTTEPTEEPTITIQTIAPGGGKGYIDTYANIDGAAVSFDGAYQCTIAQGVCTVGVSPSGTPVRTVSVAKAGYTTWSGALPHMPADGEHVAVHAILNPVPAQTGTIYAQSSPAGAAIYLNGNFYGYAPVTIPSLVPASYTMKASLSGYSPDSQIVTVYAGQTAGYYPVLSPSPPPPRDTGTVRVSSNPSSAEVRVDGTYYGKTPITVTLFPGSHSFRISLNGYNDYTTNVYVSANTNQNLNAILQPAMTGTVALTSLPGAAVYMDSAPQGNVPATGTLVIANVANGNRLFKVSATGYNDWLNSVYVQPNAVTTITAALSPSGTAPTPVAATGGITIVSTPAGAEIYLDNLFKGYTPATMTDIPAGNHQLMLKAAGYVDYQQPVAVGAGSTVPLAIALQPAPTPAPTRAGPEFPLVIGEILAAAGIAAILGRRT